MINLEKMRKQSAGTRIKAVRKQAGLNQTEFAKKLNVQQCVVSQWEHGNRSPDVTTIGKIALLCDTTCDYIILGR